eukprot:CAMPEP_0116970902 /NCGR_PEP_ID=MMETSP0467-20121206/52845_1 /TAXON_ID=283647 /ORGANISM="Mesodinium pulex, Strain SPMC105" /LENGTH=76 /DNA_ID=CAMNT_0004661935 /DNA_START=1156 /DNA_END=1386 /DNA_ORIENTATION=-
MGNLPQLILCRANEYHLTLYMANNGKVFAFIEVNEAEYQKDPKNYKFYIHITNQKFKLIKSLLVDEVVNVILITDK